MSSVISTNAFPSPPWGGVRGGGLQWLAAFNVIRFYFTPTRPGQGRATLPTGGRATKAYAHV